MGLDLSRPTVERLTERTEGWVAGLQLAGLSLRRSTDADAFVDAFGATDRYIFDYLTDETLAHLPAGIRDFLEATCILGRLSAGLCDAVTGRGDGAARLATLANANLFLAPLDDRGEWFRYHGLFADLVASGLDATRRVGLHRRAAHWFAEHGLAVEAIRHALAAGDAEAAATLVEAAAEGALARGETATLLGWCDALPADVVRAHPDLGVARAWAAFMIGEIAGAETLLADVPAGDGIGERAAAHRAALEAWFANRRDDPAAEALARDAIGRIPDTDPVFRSLGFITLGESLVGRDTGAGVEAFEEAHRLALRSGRSALLGGALYSLANTFVAQGRRSEAEALCRRTIDEVTAAGRATPSWLGMVHLPLGAALFEADELVQARQHIATGQELCDRARLRVTMLGASEWYEVLALHLLGEPERAWRRLESIRREAHRVGVVRVAMAMALAAAELLLLEGDPAGARLRLDGAPAVHPDVLGTVRDRSRQTWSRVLVAQGRPAEALAILGPLADEQRTQGRLGRLVATLLTRAVAHDRLRDRAAAVEAIAEAVAIAGAEGYRRAFRDPVLAVGHLLPPVRHLSPAFVDGLGAVLGDAATRGRAPTVGGAPAGRAEAGLPPWRAPGATSRGGGGPVLVEPLTLRELEVLRLVTAGLSNEEIGRALFISTGTAKWHVHNLLGKVGARTRVGLVAEARTLELL
jgi:LuxR family maltose regulon positive regulatory protein